MGSAEVIVVDTSALLAIVLDEPERPAFGEYLLSVDCLVATPTVLEAHLALDRFRAREIHPVLDLLLNRPNVDIVPFDEGHLRLARSAFDLYGRGRGNPARLNFGDCMSYALARERNLPLLFKGDDFVHTDLKPAFIP